MNWKEFFFIEQPENMELHKVMNARAHEGNLRLGVAAKILGDRNMALALAKEIGPYILADQVAHRLRLEGLALDSKGEIPVLSPSRWADQKLEARSPLELLALEWEELGLQLAGILVEKSEFSELMELKALARELDAWGLVSLYEHFSFHRKRHMNLLAITRPRV